MAQLLAIFLNVLAPVFLLVLLGVVVGPRLQLDSRTMSRFAYFVLTPAFVFDVLSKAVIDAALAARMTVYILLVHVLCALVAFGVAKALRRSPPMTAAYVLIAVFSNVGNFGLPIIQFQFPGEQAALAAATVYFVAILTISFVIGVAAANMVRGGNLAAVAAVLKTPGVIAVAPALLVNAAQVPLPLVLTRPVSLLAGALIPTMLVALGVQLSQVGIPRITADMVIACVLRLAVGPALAFALVGVFGLASVEGSVGILQASMPAAVLASIIAVENDLLPSFVIATVLVSTLASVVSLTVVLALLSFG